MKRRILIITNPGEKGDKHYCEGVYRDKENYLSYFQEPYGGYYSRDEIRYFDKPNKITVLNELNNLKSDGVVLSIIIFCGHGWYSSKSGSNILKLNAFDEFDSLDLRKDYNRRIVILDCCREVQNRYILEEKFRSYSEIIKGSTTRRLDPIACRNLYNAQVQQSPSQFIVTYGCSINEYCGDDSQFGGYYSSSLVIAAKGWVETHMNKSNTAIFSISIAHEYSKPRVEKLSDGKQNPTIELSSRSGGSLPFGVLA